MSTSPSRINGSATEKSSTPRTFSPQANGPEPQKSSTPRTFLPGSLREQARAEYAQSTKELLFTKDFRSRQEAVMGDPLEPIGQRFMAWLLLRSWGNYALYAINDDGTPAIQADCARELGVDRRRIAAAVGYYRQRGYLEVRGKMLYPVISPVLASPPPDEEEMSGMSRTFSKMSGEYRTFLEQWKVAHSSDFEELEVALSTVKRIRKVLLSEYKKSRHLAEKKPPSLCRELEIKTETTTAALSPSPEPSAAAVNPPPPKPEKTEPNEVQRTQKALSRYGSCDVETAERLLSLCRQECPEASVEDVELKITEKAQNINRNTQSPIGLLIKIVPKGFRGFQHQPPKPPEPTERERQVAYAREHEAEIREAGDWEATLEHYPELRE